MTMHRRDAVAALLHDRGSLLVTTGLGGTAWDVAAAGDCDHDLPLWGAMGGAAMVGLGLALARPDRPVLVVTGDGEQLMALGALATIAVAAPANLAVVVIDNGVYGETGGQTSHTGAGVDLAAVAAACGIGDARTVRRESELGSLRDAIHACAGPLLAVVKVAVEELPLVLPPRDGVALIARVRAALDVPA
jgi:thiamine pyrophosphate-dependent acetolactate synthase large subunit-like protein